jgi:hypothetical protein
LVPVSVVRVYQPGFQEAKAGERGCWVGASGSAVKEHHRARSCSPPLRTVAR